MPNKYYVSIPYSYTKFGSLTCYCYGEDLEEIQDLLYECENRYNEDFCDNDSDGDTEFDYSDASIELEEEDVSVPHSNNNSNNSPFSNVPDYFLAELAQL